jgi:hypothetical protein
MRQFVVCLALPPPLDASPAFSMWLQVSYLCPLGMSALQNPRIHPRIHFWLAVARTFKASIIEVPCD